MAKEAVFTMKLEPELRDAFMAAAKVSDRPASQIVREMMTDFVVNRREEQEYREYYRQKVGRALASIEAGRWYSSEDVEAEFAKRREAALRRADESDA